MSKRLKPRQSNAKVGERTMRNPVRNRLESDAPGMIPAVITAHLWLTVGPNHKRFWLPEYSVVWGMPTYRYEPAVG